MSAGTRKSWKCQKTILSGRPNPYLVGGHLHRSLLEFQKNHIIWSGSHIIWSGSHIIWSEGGQRHSIASIATLIVDGWVSGLELSGREAILSGYLVCEPFLRQPWKCQKTILSGRPSLYLVGGISGWIPRNLKRTILSGREAIFIWCVGPLKEAIYLVGAKPFMSTATVFTIFTSSCKGTTQGCRNTVGGVSPGDSDG